MALINITYNEQYFRGKDHSQTADGGYDNYRWDTYLTQDSSVLADEFILKSQNLGSSILGRKVLVLGCAYGFLVKFLVSKGVDAYGLDISGFAISQIPELSSRLIVGDMRIESDYIAAKNLAGLVKANEKFDMIIDEDAICCFTNDDAISVCSLMRKYGNFAIHLVDTSPNLANWYNFHTISEWKNIIGVYPKEKWYSRYTWSE